MHVCAACKRTRPQGISRSPLLSIGLQALRQSQVRRGRGIQCDGEVGEEGGRAPGRIFSAGCHLGAIWLQAVALQALPASATLVHTVPSTLCLLHLVPPAGSVSLFPTKSRNNFCYVSVDPLRRLARLWYHGMMPFW